MKKQMLQVTRQFFNDPNLMEVEIKYLRDDSFELKAMIDGQNGVIVIYKKYSDGKLIKDDSFTIPLDPNVGSANAGNKFDSIVLGK